MSQGQLGCGGRVSEAFNLDVLGVDPIDVAVVHVEDLMHGRHVKQWGGFGVGRVGEEDRMKSRIPQRGHREATVHVDAVVG